MYPFSIKCYLYIRPNLRTDSLEMEMYMGRTILDAMYDDMKEQPGITKLFLSFPERWLNLVEQRQIYDRCKLYLPNLKELTLKTHSVFITQCTPNGSLLVVDTSNRDLKESNVTVSHCSDVEAGSIDMSKISVLHMD